MVKDIKLIGFRYSKINIDKMRRIKLFEDYSGNKEPR
jgi:hypothetical protein